MRYAEGRPGNKRGEHRLLLRGAGEASGLDDRFDRRRHPTLGVREALLKRLRVGDAGMGDAVEILFFAGVLGLLAVPFVALYPVAVDPAVRVGEILQNKLRACYELLNSSRASIRQAKAAKCNPISVRGSRS